MVKCDLHTNVTRTMHSSPKALPFQTCLQCCRLTARARQQQQRQLRAARQGFPRQRQLCSAGRSGECAACSNTPASPKLRKPPTAVSPHCRRFCSAPHVTVISVGLRSSAATLSATAGANPGAASARVGAAMGSLAARGLEQELTKRRRLCSSGNSCPRQRFSFRSRPLQRSRGAGRGPRRGGVHGHLSRRLWASGDPEVLDYTSGLQMLRSWPRQTLVRPICGTHGCAL